MKFKVVITNKEISINGVKTASMRLSHEVERTALILAQDRIQKRLDCISSPLNQKEEENEQEKNK